MIDKIKLDDIESLELKLLKKGYFGGSIDNLHFRKAALYGKMRTIKYYVEEKKFPIHKNNNDALWVASRNGHDNIVKYLIKNYNCNQSFIWRYFNKGTKLTKSQIKSIKQSTVKEHQYILKSLILQENSDTIKENLINTAGL